jgi:hypothetical protein
LCRRRDNGNCADLMVMPIRVWIACWVGDLG